MQRCPRPLAHDWVKVCRRDTTEGSSAPPRAPSTAAPLSVFERKHEIGMLRAIGLHRTQIKQMVRIEAITIALFGAVLGIGLGFFLAWAAGKSITGILRTYTMDIPYGRIAFFFLMSGVVGVLAALWPARRAARLNPLEAIKTD